MATQLKMKSLHISNRQIEPTERTGITDGTSGTIARLELNAISTSQTNLIQMELLRSSGRTSGDISFGGDEELDKV